MCIGISFTDKSLKQDYMLKYIILLIQDLYSKLEIRLLLVDLVCLNYRITVL